MRRAGGGVIHLDTLSLRDEFELLVAAREAGVRVPEPVAYLGELDGREAFVMERVHGETIGRRIVKAPPEGLDAPDWRRSWPESTPSPASGFRSSPTPTSSPGCTRSSTSPPSRIRRSSTASPGAATGFRCERPPVVGHGDFRIGNVMVDQTGVVAVLDWEFAHVSDPLEDLAWPLVRAWRFGADERRLGGVAAAERFLARYTELTGRDVPLDELYAWEVLGNCKWAIGSLSQTQRHLRGEERNVELAILGRLAAEMEYELLDLIERAA